MSTPPTLSPEQNPAPPPPRPRANLAKTAVILAVTMVVTFGLCSFTLIRSNSAMSGPVFPAAIIIEAICIISLIVVAILAIARRNKPN